MRCPKLKNGYATRAGNRYVIQQLNVRRNTDNEKLQQRGLKIATMPVNNIYNETETRTIPIYGILQEILQAGRFL
jgi:hypothetical protein